MTVDEAIRAVTRLQRKTYLMRRAAIVFAVTAILCLGLRLFGVAPEHSLTWLGPLALGALVIFLIRFRSQPIEVALQIDERLSSKERVVSALDLLSKGQEDGASRIVTEQAAAALSGFDPGTIQEKTTSPWLLLVIGTLAMVLCWVFSNPKSGERFASAAAIEQLLEEKQSLPEPLKESLENLVTAIDEKGLGSEAVETALKNAEQELKQAESELRESDKTIKESDAVAQLTPTPTPIPPAKDEPKKEDQKEKSPKDTDVQNDKSSQDQADKEKSSKSSSGNQGDQGQDSKQQQNQQHQEQSQSGQGQGQGQEKSDQQNQGNGQGQDQKDGQKGQGAGQGNQQPQDQQSNDSKGESEGKGEGQGKQQGADQSQDQNGKKGKSAGQQGQDLKDVKQALKDAEQQQRDAQKNKGEGQGAGQQTKDGKKEGDNKGGNKDQQSQAGDKPNDQQQSESNKPSDQGKQGKEKSEQVNSDQSKDSKSSKSNQSEGESDSAALPSPGEKGDPNKALSGDGKDKLGPNKGFKEEHIEAKDEKIDERFATGGGGLVKRKGEVKYSTQVSSAELGQQKSLKDSSKQPIPLEYRDLLN